MKMSLLVLMVLGLHSLCAMEHIDPYSVFIVTEKGVAHTGQGEDTNDVKKPIEKVVMVDARLGEGWLMPLYCAPGSNDPMVMKPGKIEPGKNVTYVYKRFNGVWNKGKFDEHVSQYHGDILLVPIEELRKYSDTCYYKVKNDAKIDRLKKWDNLIESMQKNEIYIQKNADLDSLLVADPAVPTPQPIQDQTNQHNQLSTESSNTPDEQVEITENQVLEVEEEVESIPDTIQDQVVEEQDTTANQPLLSQRMNNDFPDRLANAHDFFFLNKETNGNGIVANTGILVARRKDERAVLIIAGNTEVPEKKVLINKMRDWYVKYSPEEHGDLEWIDKSSLDVVNGEYQIHQDAMLDQVCVPYKGETLYKINKGTFSGAFELIHELPFLTQSNQTAQPTPTDYDIQVTKRNWNEILLRGTKEFFGQPKNTALFITGCLLISGVVYLIVRTVQKEKIKKAKASQSVDVIVQQVPQTNT